MIYDAILTPHLLYCNIAWATSSNYSMLRLFRLQKKAVRLVSHASFLAHTSPIFYRFKILNIYDLNNFNIAIFMYLCFKNCIPTSLSKYFCLNSEVRSYNMRSQLDYHLPLFKTNVGLQSVFYTGPKIWNSLLN